MLPSLETKSTMICWNIHFIIHLPEFVRCEGSPDIPHHIVVAGHELPVLPGPQVLLALGDQLGVAGHGPGHCLHQPLVPLHVSTRVRDSSGARVGEGTRAAPTSAS